MSVRPRSNARSPFAQWLLLAAALLLVGSGLGARLYSDHETIDARERVRLESYGRIVDDNLGHQLRSTSNALKSIRSELPYLTAQREGVALVNRRLKSMSDGMPGVRTLLVLDATGTVSASNREELIGRNFREREYFRVAQREGNPATLYVSPPFRTALGAFSIALVTVITDERGAFSGIVGATLDQEYFSTLLNSIRFAPDVRTSIVHSDGTVFVNSPPLPGVDGINLAIPGTFFTRHKESGQRTSLFTGTVYATGDERMMHQRTGEISGLALDRPLVFAVSRDRPMIFADWRRDAYGQAAGFWLLVLIASSGLHLFQRRQRAYDRLLAIQEVEHKQADEALRRSEARFRQAFERNESVMLLIDPRSGEIADANAAAARFYGYSIEHLKTMRIQQINMLSPDEVADARAQVARHERHVFVFPHRLADGSVRTVEVRSSPIEVGNFSLLFSIIIDITERKRSEEALRISESRHRLLADNARDVIWTMAPDGAITYVSPSVETVRGFTPAEAMLQTTDEILTPASQAVSLGYFTQLHADLAVDRPTRSFRDELEYRCKDGSTVWTEVMAFPLFSDEGLVELLGVTRDISEHKRLVLELQQARDATETANQALLHANAELAGIAITDALTGAWNRRHFERVADAAAAQASRYQQPLSLLIFDIDHFKSINDRYGHLAGDHVLIELTQLVGRALRDADVLARWGGEEFVVIMPHCGASGALLLANKLRALVAAHLFAEVGTVTISLGAAEFKPGEALDDWFKRVDHALYEAKVGGRNAVRLGT